MRTIPLICVSGKSGVGKTTIVRASGLKEVISYTTRSMRPGEVDGFDYHFTNREWMLKNRENFRLDWKFFGENIYGATDFDVENLDVIVITLDSAIELRKLGVLVYIIWLDGPVRTDRNRKVNVENGPELMKQVDQTMTNNCCVDRLAEELRVLKSSLTTICDAIT